MDKLVCFLLAAVVERSSNAEPRQGQQLEKMCAMYCWAEAPIKIARMTLTIKLDGNWSSFQLANNTPPLSVTGSVIAPSARMTARDQLVLGRDADRSSCTLRQMSPKATEKVLL